MEPFKITPESLQAIKKLKEWAEAHPFTDIELRAIKRSSMPAPAEWLNHMIKLGDMRVVFTIEQQAAGRIKHLSIDTKTNEFPDPETVCDLLEQFGFIHNLKHVPTKGEFHISITGRVINFFENEGPV